MRHAGRRAWLTVAAVLCAVLPGCVSYETLYVGDADYRLHALRAQDGTVRTYDVVSSLGVPTIVITEDRPELRTTLGLETAELTDERAGERGLRPYSGLLVTAVADDSPAARAGVRVGDVLRSVDGQPMHHDEELAAKKRVLRPGATVELVVARGPFDDGAGESGAGRTPAPELRLSVAPDYVERRVRDTEYVDLPVVHREDGKPFAGFSASTIPSELHARMFGESRPIVLLTNVVPGSPAYLAGLRSGDLVESVDGEYVRSAEELVQRIQERGQVGGTMHFAVSRDVGRYFETDVALADYTRSTEVHVPLVFGVDSGSQTTRWEVGPLGSVMAYRSSYVDSPTRAPAESGAFSMVLGLVRYDWSPSGTSTRLLWLIRFET